MQTFKKILRHLCLVILLLLASIGIGLAGPFLPPNREPYQDKQVRTERVDKKEDEEENETEEIKLM